MRALINGIQLNCTDNENQAGLPVVFIHGFPLSHEMWRPQIQALEKDYRVIAYDIRGHGESDAGDGQYLLEFFVDDLIGLLDHLKVERPVLCGLSMGGYIALRAIERNPERCRALVLCDTRSEADSNEGKLKRTAAIKTAKEKGVKVFGDEFIKPLFAPQTFTSNPGAVEMIRGIIHANPAIGVCGALQALAARTDTTPSLPKISVPTLILVGEHDALTPPAAAEAMHAKIPNSELRVIPNAGHMSNLENPQEFNKHLLEFLKRLS